LGSFFSILPEGSLKTPAVYPDPKMLLHFIQERGDPHRMLPGREPFDKGQHFGRELMSASRAALSGQKPWYALSIKLSRRLIERGP
jgi:hypothetical protein